MTGDDEMKRTNYRRGQCIASVFLRARFRSRRRSRSRQRALEASHWFEL